MATEETRPSYGGDGKPTAIPFFQDGRGGSESLTLPVYYRVYTKDGPLESYHPVYSNDRFISRIASSSVRLPHTAASLMRNLCKIEGLALQNCILFQSLSEMTPLDNSIHLSLRGTTGPGASDLNPTALVVDRRTAERISQVTSVVEPQELFEGDSDERYVYYRVYNDDGETVPKTSFGEHNPSLGRVNILSVPPPYTVSSLKNRIIQAEDVSGHNFQLFEDEGSQSAMNDSDALTLLSDATIAYESGTTDGSADNEDTNEIQIRELREALAQMKEKYEANLTHTSELEEANRTLVRELAEVREGWNKAMETHECEMNEALSSLHQFRTQMITLSVFSKKLRATRDWGERRLYLFQVGLKSHLLDMGVVNATWHSLKMGEIFYTDGIFRREKWRNGPNVYGIYQFS
ncbi:uncharacterized protein LACBIDRAFT_321352 [Laccaria bicolor S238N-H82]|uniref:Predicted protein n=1 Tax=Laccaria bicolor (strain S238N-H82 / ATCC MYA-4686) TaxID=486041 RepID=B0CPW8_LACBS|nr:uncharacterized protein LACBIDRAFT_321352 [Laccaria bicolor S238N-H82]EDR15485.1 predicted protein [Laccaria bicolor S238N-H82]|eukprot:XP_001873693.1 predicted protein [Laccaria bicolor S238N-H82]